MKPRPLYLFFTILLILSHTALAQVYTRRIPAGNNNDFNKAGAIGNTGSIPRKSFKAVDTQALLQEDAQRTKLGLPERMGVDILIMADFMEIATKITEGSYQFSRFQFDVPSAQGLSMMFDTLALASGAQLFIYNADQTVLIGPVTENQNGRNYWSDLVPGENLIVELKEPLAVAGQSTVQVSKLIQFYRYVSKFGFNTSSSCEINTACYPGYQNEADGVAMMLTYYSPYTYACTGSILNTTQQNFRSFLLTAFHCFDFSGDGTLQTAERNATASTQVRFHWESPVCSPTAADNVYLTLTGGTLQAAYVNSDFSLLEINQQVPSSENITYLGWDRNNSNFSSVFGIHHPSADIKKISFSNNATSFVGTVMSAGGNYYTVAGSTHLNVTWNASPNTLGVTEGGSSGSALFNPDRRVIGQLHGGGSYCNSPASPDQYGRLYTSWTGGGNSTTRLSDWLNPTGSSSLTVNSVKTQLTGPSTFTATATFALNTGSSTITSWSITGASGVISPASGSGNVANITASGSVAGATITFWVAAGQTYSISFSKSFTAVAGSAENFPPQTVNIPAQTATVGTLYAYTVPAFIDPEGLSLTYTASNLPAGLAFNPLTRLISGTPTTSGSYVSSITATDQGGLEASVAFLFTVTCPNLTLNASALTLCQGQPVTLNAGGANTYLWSTGANTAAINPAPAQTTTYSLTGITNGCASVTAVTVAVQALPLVIISTSNSAPICSGQTVSLSASGATSYLWSNGETGTSIQVAPMTTTTYSVVGTINGCTGVGQITRYVTPCPLTLSAVITDCTPGQLSLQLNASGGTGSPYQYAGVGVTAWTTQSGPFAVSVYADTTPLNIWVRNTDNPAYLVQYTLSIPACARPLPVTINQPASETGSQPLHITGASINCSNQRITISTTGGSNATLYQRIVLVTGFLPINQDLILDYGVFAERKPVQLQVQQNGVSSPLFTFDYTDQCPLVTITPPATQTFAIPQQSCASPAATLGQPLALSASLTCQGSNGVLSFFPRGGQLQANTVFEFMSPGITGWTTSCTVSVTEADPVLVTFVRQRNVVTNEVLAQTTYTLTNPCASGAGRTALTDDSFSVSILGNPTTARQATVAIAGRAGQQLWLTVTDTQGRIISSRQIDATPWPVPYQAELGSAAGVYLLTVRSIQKRQTFSIIRY